MTEQLSGEMQERMDRLRERANAPAPPAWRPEVGDEIMGVVVRIMRRPTAFDPTKPKPVVTVVTGNQVRTENDIVGAGREVSIWLLHTVAENEFEKLDVQVGELVYVRYDGHKDAVGGGPGYEAYTINVDRPDPARFDWGVSSPS